MQSLKKIHAWAQMQVPLYNAIGIPLDNYMRRSHWELDKQGKRQYSVTDKTYKPPRQNLNNIQLQLNREPYRSFTLYIPIDYHIHIGTMSKELSIKFL